MIYTAIATGVAMPLLFSGRSSNDDLLQATAQHPEARFAEHDKQDSDSIISLGLIIALAAILAGGSGYLCTLLEGEQAPPEAALKLQPVEAVQPHAHGHDGRHGRDDQQPDGASY